ncbi:MAG: transposase [Lachnoanaerobaculum sp.]|uniref:transposase n=1 Tax=Lachnoanaerobaculum sp. TaxID=2049030 RepID=UPI0025C543F9|nr:transposase [Lachnoanaerobaculum sp.]MBS5881952.1 transposase [Lachnoanaerobaculum sp.]
MKNIRLIYDASKQNYSAPKITKELRKSGETITERTVGKYMREIGIKAQRGYELILHPC